MSRTVLVSYLLAAGQAFAQTSIQEVLDAGGKRLNTEQLTSLMVHTRFTGLMSQGYETDFKMFKDYSFSGYVYPNGQMVAAWGSWKIENDSYCIDMKYTGGGISKFCNGVFELEGKYFVGGAKAEPGGSVQQRKFKPL